MLFVFFINDISNCAVEVYVLDIVDGMIYTSAM